MFIYVLCIAMRALYRTLAKVYIKLNLNLNPRKINKRINSHPVSTLAKKRIDRLRLEHLALLCGNKDLTFPSSPYQRCSAAGTAGKYASVWERICSHRYLVALITPFVPHCGSQSLYAEYFHGGLNKGTMGLPDAVLTCTINTDEFSP